MAAKDLRSLFVHQLNDTLAAERAILRALPKLGRAANTEELKGALGVHAEETKAQIGRLEKVFELIGQKPQPTECKAIQGLIEEGDEIAQQFEGGEALDAGVISAAQAVEHYEITRYGTLLAWAKQLGLDDVSPLLQETLIEEENTDEMLSELAEDAINANAIAE